MSNKSFHDRELQVCDGPALIVSGLLHLVSPIPQLPSWSYKRSGDTTAGDT